MSFNRLAIQGISSAQAAAQRGGAFNGFQGLGAQDNRPSYDYVRAGDVIRIRLFLDAVFTTPPIDAFRNRLANAGGVRLVNLDQSGLGSLISGYAGALVVEVQATSDFSRLDDVTRLVAGVAQGAGLSVLIGSTRGEFVSKVEATGGNVPSNIPAPGSNNPNGANDVSKALSDFFSNLTKSPVTLAVILGAAVVLVIAAKK